MARNGEKWEMDWNMVDNGWNMVGNGGKWWKMDKLLKVWAGRCAQTFTNGRFLISPMSKA